MVVVNVTEWQVGDLADLHWHWGDAYSITTDGDTWSASPRTDLTVIVTAETADDLRALIRTDYAQRTEVQRQPRDHAEAGSCWCGECHYRV